MIFTPVLRDKLVSILYSSIKSAVEKYVKVPLKQVSILYSSIKRQAAADYGSGSDPSFNSI